MNKKVILVTGASGGLGLATAVLFAKAGHRVYATVRSLDRADKLRESSNGLDVSIIEQDVRNSESVSSSIAELLKREGHIDVVVCNAGKGFIRTIEQAEENEIQDVFDTNLLGIIRCIKAVIPSMRERKSGHIIAISSVGGLVGQPFNEIYCASKFAVEGLLESMATYVTPEFNIHFTLIEPGGIATNFSSQVIESIGKTGGIYDDTYKPALERYIGGSQNRSSEDVYQTAEEVAEVVLKCIESENPPLRMRTSPWAEKFCNLKTQLDSTGNQGVKETIETMMS